MRRATDPDRRQVIGRDGHLDQSPACDLGQSLCARRSWSVAFSESETIMETPRRQVPGLDVVCLAEHLTVSEGLPQDPSRGPGAVVKATCLECSPLSALPFKF